MMVYKIFRMFLMFGIGGLAIVFCGIYSIFEIIKIK
jgi:hypothetical protein